MVLRPGSRARMRASTTRSSRTCARAACGLSRPDGDGRRDPINPRLARPGPGSARRLRRARQQARHGSRLLRSPFRVPAAAHDLAKATAPGPCIRRAACRRGSPMQRTTCRSGASSPSAASMAKRPRRQRIPSDELLADEVRTRRLRHRSPGAVAGQDSRMGRRAQLPGAQHAARRLCRSATGHSSIIRAATCPGSTERWTSCARAIPIQAHSIARTSTTTPTATPRTRAGTRSRCAC